MLKQLCMTVAIVGLMSPLAVMAEEGNTSPKAGQEKAEHAEGKRPHLRDMDAATREAYFADHPEAKERFEKKRQEFIAGLSEEERKEWEALPEGQKQEFWKKRKEKWEKMSDAEKITIINKKHDDMVKRHAEKWSTMTDAEKIKMAEKRMQRHDRRHGMGGEHGEHGGGEGPGDDSEK